MKKLHNNALFLGIVLIFSSFSICMNNTTENKLKERKFMKIISTTPVKLLKTPLSLSIIDRSISPTLSPNTQPRQKHKRPASPLSNSSSKNEPESLDILLLKLTKNGNIVELKEKLHVLDQSPYKISTLGKIMHMAIRNNNFNILRFILEDHADEVDIEFLGTKKQTPLIRASKKGSYAIVNHLLCYGANINAQSKKGDTPLHKAAKFDNSETMRLLLRDKKSINIEIKNLKQQTALCLAVEKAQFGSFHLLKSQGAQISVISQYDRNLLHTAVLSCYLPILLNLLETTELDLNACDNKFQTPLDIARKIDDKTLIKTLEFYQDKHNLRSKG